MKTNLFKTVLALSFLMLGIGINAQVFQTLCVQEERTYTVDEADPSPDGSYSWTLTDEVGNDLSGSISTGQGSNSITIDWSDAAFTIGTTYTITVIETIDGCEGEPQLATINLLEGYEAPEITPMDFLCEGDVNEFLLTGGTAGGVVAYTITSDNLGFTTINGTVTLDVTDTPIPVPPLTDENSSETFTLTLISIDVEGDDCDALILTTDNIQSVTVNPAPETTEIQF